MRRLRKESGKNIEFEERLLGTDLRSRESWLKWWCHDEGLTAAN